MSPEETILCAAAVSHFIDPTELASRTQQAPELVATVLLPKVETELDDSGARRWTLRASVRREVLATAPPPLIRQWASLPPDGAIEQVLRDWLLGKLDLWPALQTSREAVQRVIGWLRNVPDLVPPAQEAARFVELAGLRQQLANAASSSFVGREEDRAWLQRQLDGPSRAAVLEAKGGMGKSALLARWLLDRDAYSLNGLIALVVDFDDPALTVTEPDLVYAEIARQAGLQLPGLLTEGIQHQVREALQSHGESIRFTERGLNDSRLYSLMYDVMAQTTASGRPVVIVLDTMERAMTAPLQFVDSLVLQLRQLTPALVVAGRGPIQLPSLAGVERRALEPLAKGDGMELLGQHGVGAGTAARILAQVPASPLTLRLASRAVKKLGPELLDDDSLSRAIDRAQIDGYLHARVLEHLPSPRLARVGRSALLLRSLTPEHLVSIVGPTVEPPISPDEARDLFGQLSTVNDLVTMTAPAQDRLRLRPELFDELTQMIEAEDPGLAAEVHTRAAEVLAKSGQPGDDVERDYHVAAFAKLRPDFRSTLTSAPALPLRQLHTLVPALLQSGRASEALATVEREPGAYRDAALLLCGARAARALGEVDRCDALVRGAAVVATTPLERAQAALYAGWVAERRGDPDLARRLRLQVREALFDPQLAAGLPVERAELLVAVESFNHPWVQDQLRALFARYEDRNVLLTGDRDLQRRVAAIVRTTESLAWAADMKLFDYEREVDLSPLADLLLSRHREQLANLQLGSERAEVVARLRSLQRTRSLSSPIFSLVSSAGADEELLEVLAELLKRMSESDRAPSVPLDANERGRRLAQLAEGIAAADQARLRELFTAVLERDVRQLVPQMDQAQRRSVVGSLLVEVDRARRGWQLVRELRWRKMDTLAAAAAELFPESGA